MTNNKHILLVDDDEDDRALFVEAMQEISATTNIRLAKNGVDALEKLTGASFLPDLIFMDLNMPLMGGIECLSYIKKHSVLKHIPIAILTTSQNSHELKAALTNGANFFLVKPLTYSLLKQNLTEVLNIVAEG